MITNNYADLILANENWVWHGEESNQSPILQVLQHFMFRLDTSKHTCTHMLESMIWKCIRICPELGIIYVLTLDSFVWTLSGEELLLQVLMHTHNIHTVTHTHTPHTHTHTQGMI